MGVLLEHERQVASQGIGACQLIQFVVPDGPGDPATNLHPAVRSSDYSLALSPGDLLSLASLRGRLTEVLPVVARSMVLLHSYAGQGFKASVFIAGRLVQLRVLWCQPPNPLPLESIINEGETIPDLLPPSFGMTMY